MTRKFPKSIQLTIGRRLPASPAKPPFVWEVHARADQARSFLVDGDAQDRADAREQAWLALEQLGLVVDE